MRRTHSLRIVILLIILFWYGENAYAQAPIVTSFTPAAGPVGTLVTVNGSHLDNLTALVIGGSSAVVVSNSGTLVSALVMPGAITGNVSLTNAGGTSTTGSNFTVKPTLYPSSQNILVQPGPAAFEHQLMSVAISSDGNTAVFGQPIDSAQTGSLIIYTRNNGTWVQQGPKLYGAGTVGTSRMGASVSLSADGNTVIAGGYLDNGNIGAAWVFNRSNGVWAQQGNKLVGTDATFRTAQGESVSISADGNTVIVGGNGDNFTNGAAWVFTRNSGVWAQQAKLFGTGSIGLSNQGWSVALSADGNTAIVGGNGDNNGVGAAWVYTRNGGGWTQQGAKLTGSGSGNTAQGSSVALSADGNSAIVGAYSDNSGIGAARVFTRSNGVWTQEGTKLVGTGNAGNSSQGWSVALSADGNTAVVGAPDDNNSTGAAWVYTRSNGTWTQQGSKLVGPGLSGQLNEGWGISLTGDGSSMVIGNNSFAGAAWIFSAAPIPTVTTIAATLLTSSGATLNGVVNDNGSGTAVTIEYGTTPDLTDPTVATLSTGNSPIPANTGNVNFTSVLTGLTPATAYYFRVKAVSSSGTNYGSTLSFRTLSPPSIVSFSPEAGPTGTTVTLAGANFNITPSNNIVFFGATKATVTAATTTSLTVIVPVGATYQNISVTDITSALTGWSAKPFMVIYNNGVVDVAAKVDVALSSSANPGNIAIGDLDGDGKSDLVVVNYSTNTMSVYHNASSIGSINGYSFATSVDFATGFNPISVTIGDVDGDGKPDLIVANQYSNSVSVYRNTTTIGSITNSSFAAKVDFALYSQPPGAQPLSIAISDFDGDGKPDIAVANAMSNTISIFRNTSSKGNITSTSFAPRVDFTTGSQPTYINIGDIDGDGKPDIVTANFYGNSISVFRNTSTLGNITAGSFAGKVDFAAGINPRSIAIGDLNGDGKVDLAVANVSNNTISVFQNTSIPGSITANSLADKIDLATELGPYNLTFGDVDGDGKMDILVVNINSNTVSVYRNIILSGNLTVNSFAAGVDFTTGSTPLALACGDLDGDGKPDIAVLNNRDNTISLFRNAPPPAIASFSPAQGYTGTTITITGTNFTGATQVSFGGAPASSFTVNSSTSITAVVGAGASGNVTVSSARGTTSIAGFTFGTALDKTGNGQIPRAAYSLRQLKTAYTHAAITPPATIPGFTNATAPVIRVRRSSDNGQLDIGYTANGDLDTLTLKSFAGTGSAYVATWYDQSSNSYDVTQSVLSKQPAIITSGVVERSGLMPAVKFSFSAQTVLQNNVPATTMFGSGYIGYVFPVMEAAPAASSSSAFGYGSGTNRWQVHDIAGAYFDVGSPAKRVETANSSYVGTLRNYSFIADSSLQQIYVNGALQASATVALTPCTQTQFNIGGIPAFVYYHYNHESEIIIYGSRLSTADRQAVENNQGTYYYTPSQQFQTSGFSLNMGQPQIASSGLVNLDFKVSGGTGDNQYQIQKSGSNSFYNIDVKNGGSGIFTSSDTDVLNGDNHYRVIAIDKQGKKTYSQTVKLTLLTGGRGIIVAPNPIENNAIVLNFNKMPKGRYKVDLAAINGVVLISVNISYNGYSPSVTIPTGGIRPAVYFLNINSEAYQRLLKVIVQ